MWADLREFIWVLTPGLLLELAAVSALVLVWRVNEFMARWRALNRG